MKFAKIGLLAILAVTACSTPKIPTERDATPALAGPQPAEVLQARAFEQAGDFQAAARLYNQLAAQASGAERADYQLQAAATLLRGNFLSQAKRALASVEEPDLTPPARVRRQLLAAHIFLMEQNPQAALDATATIADPYIDPELQATYHRLRAEAYGQLGDTLNLVRERVALEPLLPTVEEALNNERSLWKALAELPPGQLAAMRIQPPPDTVSGWLELAQLYQTAHLPSVQMANEIAKWQNRYPAHPASKRLIEALLALQSDLAYRPQRVALLLPQTGPFAAPAGAIRDGFITAYYNQTGGEYQPDIRVYDVGEPETAQAAYERAVSDGAEIVIGPLRKETVDVLASAEYLPVPTIALNYSSGEGPYPQNLYQFGLSPEDEARQVAERAWLDGHNQAIALIPEGPWGARILNAFRERWEHFGGGLLEIQTYPQQENDFSTPLQALLNVDESKERIRELRRIVGATLENEPRRRQDVDFVFVAALPQQARQIRPQLKFYYASDLPVYATSHVYTGSVDQALDRDMDDIIFCDMPWVLDQPTPNSQLWSVISKLWPEESESYRRFYALGVDAFNLIPHLRRISTYRYEQFQGETGALSLDESNRFRRQLTWARFANGTPSLLQPDAAGL